MERSAVTPRQSMSTEYAGERQMRIGSGDGRTTAIPDPVHVSATSSPDLESMLKQALCRIDSLERQHEEIKTLMERETKALRAEICALKEENKALQADDIGPLKSENEALKWSLVQLASKVREGWEYQVAIQPDEHWQGKGYGLDAIQDLHYCFFRGLKRAVSSLGLGVCSHVIVGHADGHVDHDEDLMPHWNALFHLSSTSIHMVKV